MAQLLRDNGEGDKGIDFLARIYRAFKVSDETPDLLDARSELEAREQGPAGAKKTFLQLLALD
jgi:hypothetical protein